MILSPSSCFMSRAMLLLLRFSERKVVLSSFQ